METDVTKINCNRRLNPSRIEGGSEKGGSSGPGGGSDCLKRWNASERRIRREGRGPCISERGGSRERLRDQVL